MQAKFLLTREMKDWLDYGRVHNPYFEPHFHSHLELYIIQSGAVEVLINNKKKILRGGELAVALSYDAHGYRTVEEANAEYLIIPRSYCGDFLRVIGNKHAASPFIDDPQIYSTVFDAMEHLLSRPNELSRRGYIYIILGAILEKIVSEESDETHDGQFSAEMLIYISNHFKEEISLSSVATAFGYNPSYLSRSFRQTFGMPFGKYLNMLRLREFLLLYREGDTSVTQCALESGFGSMRSFYRAFKEEFECTPKEYFCGSVKLE